MDIEYHFYVTYIIALRAGYSKTDAFKIAYSSQYTDDNNEEFIINKGKPNVYNNFISQTHNITKPKKHLIRIYPMFHFFPGTKDEIMDCSLPRKDGKLHLLNTIPGSKNAIKLMKAALQSDNLYRIGIATHMFVDTYSHQNFAGVNDSFNGSSSLLSKIIPNVGHADAMHNPDMVNHKWEDERHTSKYVLVNNNKRFLDAAEHIFSILCSRDPYYTKQRINAKKRALISELSGALNGRKESTRIKKYKKLIGKDFIDYNKTSWRKEAVSIRYLPRPGMSLTKQRVHLWNKNHKQSDWYKFQQAVKAHQRKSESILRPVFDSMEVKKLEIW